MGPLLNNLCHHTSPHSPAAFSKSKPETLLNSNVEHKLNSEGSIIPRHNKFLPLGEGDGSGHVPSSDVHLRLVVCDKRFVSSTLFLFQNVNLPRKKQCGARGKKKGKRAWVAPTAFSRAFQYYRFSFPFKPLPRRLGIFCFPCQKLSVALKTFYDL